MLINYFIKISLPGILVGERWTITAMNCEHKMLSSNLPKCACWEMVWGTAIEAFVLSPLGCMLTSLDMQLLVASSQQVI